MDPALDTYSTEQLAAERARLDDRLVAIRAEQAVLEDEWTRLRNRQLDIDDVIRVKVRAVRGSR